MGKIGMVLSNDQLAALRGAYSRDDMATILSSGMPSQDEATLGYITAIRERFYSAGDAMQPRDRERCLIAVLASRDTGLNLALHIYIGLMEGLSPDEIADIIFLGGIYTGVDRISDGLSAEERTLTVLALIAAPPRSITVDNVVRGLVAAFRPPLPSNV